MRVNARIRRSGEKIIKVVKEKNILSRKRVEGLRREVRGEENKGKYKKNDQGAE